MLVAYADESVSQLGQKDSFAVSAFGGYVAPAQKWTQFSTQWQKVLSKYDAKSFHFREWAIAAAVAKKTKAPHSKFHKNQYCGWSQKKLDSFLYELAEIAGTVKYGGFGGFISLKRFNELKAEGSIPIGEDHRNYCLARCFHAFIDVLNTVHRPRLSLEPISFTWDGTRDKDWKKFITDAYEPYKRSNPTFAPITFADDTLCLPLQAADMVCYRIRQKADNRFAGKSTFSELDKLLFGDGSEGRLALFTA